MARNQNARSATLIEPPKRWVALELSELWRYRELMAMLVWRDVSASYRQSIVGVGWAVFRPAMSVAIFTLVFGKLARLPTDGVPYSVFNLTALIPWMYFAGALQAATGSVVGGGGLITKVYFPRLALPLASVAKGLVDLAVQSALLAGLLVFFSVAPTPRLLLLPVLVLMCVVSALAAGLWLSALNVRYRDVGHAVPFLLQAWMWLTPVVYSSSLVPERWRGLYSLNPMAGIIEAFRWAILGVRAPAWDTFIVSMVVVVAVLVTGCFYFRKVELAFADVI